MWLEAIVLNLLGRYVCMYIRIYFILENQLAIILLIYIVELFTL